MINQKEYTDAFRVISKTPYTIFRKYIDVSLQLSQRVESQI